MYKTKKYTLWSNFRFVFTPVWKEKRSYIRDMITGIILSVIVPVIGSMLSALVVGLLGESLSAVTVIAAILSAFGTGVLGLFVYMVIAGSIHPVILLLLFGLSVIGAFCNSLPDWYENKIRDENARDEMTMQYIDRLSDDAISGKDIRVFGLKKMDHREIWNRDQKYQKTQCEEEYYRICRKIVGNHSDSWTGSDLLSVSDQPVEKWNVPDDVRILSGNHRRFFCMVYTGE